MREQAVQEEAAGQLQGAQPAAEAGGQEEARDQQVDEESHHP